MGWLIANYQPVSLFSLKQGEATSTGGKSLLLPTPYSIRAALLDAAIRVLGVGEGEAAFGHIRSLALAVEPPARAVVTNLFSRVLKPAHDGGSEQVFSRTIAFREYVQLDGELGLAFGGAEGALQYVRPLLPQISYFGKRGSFYQLLRPPVWSDDLPSGFVPLDGVYIEDGHIRGQKAVVPSSGLVQMMDDWGSSLTFGKVNSFTDEKVALGKDRIRRTLVFPYRLVRGGRGFSHYDRV